MILPCTWHTCSLSAHGPADIIACCVPSQRKSLPQQRYTRAYVLTAVQTAATVAAAVLLTSLTKQLAAPFIYDWQSAFK